MAPLLLSYRFGIHYIESFVTVGEEFRDRLQAAGLSPSDHVLEIGSGTGRMAAALVPILAQGTYTGLEINRRAIDWCTRNIATQYPNCRFRHADVLNAFYNPAGSHPARHYRFPFEDGAFDFVFLTSVFTHMRFAEIVSYLGEIERVLRAGGRCFATWFLLDDDSREAIAMARSRMPFLWPFDGGLTISQSRPEEALAFPKTDVEALYGRARFQIRDLLRGSWVGGSGDRSFQDIGVAAKETH